MSRTDGRTDLRVPTECQWVLAPWVADYESVTSGANVHQKLQKWANDCAVLEEGGCSGINERSERLVAILTGITEAGWEK